MSCIINNQNFDSYSDVSDMKLIVNVSNYFGATDINSVDQIKELYRLFLNKCNEDNSVRNHPDTLATQGALWRRITALSSSMNVVTSSQVDIPKGTNPEITERPYDINQDGAQARRMCFTYNNYTYAQCEDLKNYKCNYLVMGAEVGKNGTPHLQGYIEFQGGKNFKTLHNAFPGCWFVSAKGTPQQASDYCLKGEQSHEEFKLLGSKGPNFGLNACTFSKGEMTKQGARNDLVEVADMVAKGASMYDIASACPQQMIKYHKGILNLQTTLMHKDRDGLVFPQIFWLWGASGTGKTYQVFEKHNRKDVFIKDSSMWWDGYNQQDVILIDDYEPMAFRTFLRLLDRNHMQVQCKGGFVKINSPFIYITCEFPPEHFYMKENELLQVTRRIFESGGDIINVTRKSDEISEGLKKAMAYTQKHMTQYGSGIL